MPPRPRAAKTVSAALSSLIALVSPLRAVPVRAAVELAPRPLVSAPAARALAPAPVAAAPVLPVFYALPMAVVPAAVSPAPPAAPSPLPAASAAPGAGAAVPAAAPDAALAQAKENGDRDFDGAAAARRSAVAAREPAPPTPSRPAWEEGVFLPKTVPTPLPGDALGVTVHRLANGLTVYLSPNTQESRVSFEIAVRAGSRHDPLEATGMAHYLEHMQFKGTERLGTTDYAAEKVHLDRIERLYDELFETKGAARRRAIYAEIDAESQAAARYAAPNELDKIYASAGFSDVNAHTNYDQTAYEGSFPSNRADVWAEVETERLARPVYRVFLPELEAVYEEYNGGRDNPNAAFYAAAHAALFKGHPYGREVIGRGDHLKNPSISRMRRFFGERYRPNNMALVLSGDFDRGEMLARIERTFGTLAPAKIPAPPAGRVRKLDGVRRVETRFRAERAVQIDWLLPPHNHPDEESLALAGRLFDNLLDRRVNRAQKVKGAGAYQHIFNESGVWFVVANAKDGQSLERAEKILLAEVARLKAGDFTEADLQTAVTQIEIAKKKGLQKNAGRVESIRESYVNGQEWAAAVGALERLKALTKADVVRAANRYLGEGRVVVYRRKGTPTVEKVAKPSFTAAPIDTARQSAYFRELAARTSTPLAPHFLRRGRDYETADRPWGRLYATKNRVNDLFHLEFAFDRGVAQERRLDLALALMTVSGAGDRTAEEFQKTLDRLGSTIEARCGERECTVTLTGLEKNLRETLRLALLRFEKPNVAPGDFKLLIETKRGSRADRKLDSQSVLYALADFASRGGHGESFKELTAAQLRALTERELKEVLGSVFAYRRDVLYTGARGAREAAEILTEAQPRRRFKTAPKSAAMRLLRPSRPRVVFVHQPGMTQAFVGAYAADPGDAAAPLDHRFYNTVMGNMGGIYFQEMRESRALAYTAAGGYRPAPRPGDDGEVWSYSETQADKAVQTARLMQELMARPPITPERYDLARSQVEEAYRTEVAQLEEIPQRVRYWERFGYAGDPRREAFRGLAAYTPARLAGFARRFGRTPPTLYVLGDRGSVDVEGLKKLGDFEERSVDDLFPF